MPRARRSAQTPAAQGAAAAPPSAPRLALRNTRLCRFFQRGACTRGAACTFAHAEADLLPAPDFSRTKMCPKLHECEDPQCRFAHRQHELRSQGPHAASGEKAAPRRVLKLADCCPEPGAGVFDRSPPAPALLPRDWVAGAPSSGRGAPRARRAQADGLRRLEPLSLGSLPVSSPPPPRVWDEAGSFPGSSRKTSSLCSALSTDGSSGFCGAASDAATEAEALDWAASKRAPELAEVAARSVQRLAQLLPKLPVESHVRNTFLEFRVPHRGCLRRVQSWS